MGKLIKQAVTDFFGERCPDFDPNCWCCQAWAEIDRIEAESERLVAEARAERVVVKPLVWEASKSHFLGEGLCFRYEIYETRPDEWNCILVAPHGERLATGVAPDAAKAAAEADYELRVLSAISDAPPRQVTPQEADVSASYLLEWMTHHHLPLQLWREDEGSWVIVDNSTGSVWGSGETAEIALRAALRALANGGDSDG